MKVMYQDKKTTVKITDNTNWRIDHTGFHNCEPD
ncbi:hypothetical transcript [Echinococcus multilocularis]|uniref:Hypothetical transcript n=1 Tax=Echinococcus multilocularis TaxID=6211 RepID=A0A068Y8K4_ECHMU|nr:hypothetical transcript [Echinococcus multilocularis]